MKEDEEGMIGGEVIQVKGGKEKKEKW